MIYELFLEGQLADIRQDLGMQLSYAIDDVNKYGSRETSFSKTIVLPGTANNNKIFGFVGELGSNNLYSPGAANVFSNFNPAQTTKAELRANGLLLLKGVFRLTGVMQDKGHIEYEGNLFGELGGFISAIGDGKLQDLNFSEYNHQYTVDAITKSWDARVKKDVSGAFFTLNDQIFVNGTYNLNLKVGDEIIITNADIAGNNDTYLVNGFTYTSGGTNIINVNKNLTNDLSDSFTIDYPSPEGFGSGYFYPLIDYGRYSAAKLNYDYRTFRPALFVKEYIDKMFAPETSGYTYESEFINSEFFRRLVIPSNTKQLTKIISELLDVASYNFNVSNPPDNSLQYHVFQITNVINNFTGTGNPNFTYIGTNTEVEITFKAKGSFTTNSTGLPLVVISLEKNGINDSIYTQGRGVSYLNNITINFDINIKKVISLENNDNIRLELIFGNSTLNFTNIELRIKSTNPIQAPIQLNDDIIITDSIPRNILQKDFFTWILKMFNLYVTEDKVKEKHLIIEPYKDYYDLSSPIDWTYKVARDKPWQIKPMGMLNGRFFEYKYKDDNDFYNEGYKKKYNLPYGSNLQDTFFQFAKDKQTTEVGFSPTVLVKYAGEDKVVSAIYKKSQGNDVDQEEQMDSNIRILMVKKITGVASWRITDNGADLQQTPVNLSSALTVYGYAGHFDDPTNPTIDINFGAAEEIYCEPNSYPSNNLFNTYWSPFIGEIADKDSKILTCHVYLTELDIAKLDFSKPVFIDGVLWRINKIIDYDASSNELTKVELLKVINNG
jgi:hypothetical protein